MVEEFETNSCIGGYRVYQDRWLPIIGEWLECRRESGNPRDRCAVALCKSGEIVGHVPRYISTLCSLFIRRGGAVYSIVLGGRKYSRDSLLKLYYQNEKVSLEKFHVYQLIRKIRKTFPPQTICNIRYSQI